MTSGPKPGPPTNKAAPANPGIVDCISFTIMRRLALTEAFTNDAHFTAAGFTTLF